MGTISRNKYVKTDFSRAAKMGGALGQGLSREIAIHSLVRVDQFDVVNQAREGRMDAPEADKEGSWAEVRRSRSSHRAVRNVLTSPDEDRTNSGCATLD